MQTSMLSRLPCRQRALVSRTTSRVTRATPLCGKTCTTSSSITTSKPRRHGRCSGQDLLSGVRSLPSRMELRCMRRRRRLSGDIRCRRSTGLSSIYRQARAVCQHIDQQRKGLGGSADGIRSWSSLRSVFDVRRQHAVGKGCRQIETKDARRLGGPGPVPGTGWTWHYVTSFGGRSVLFGERGGLHGVPAQFEERSFALYNMHKLNDERFLCSWALLVISIISTISTFINVRDSEEN